MLRRSTAEPSPQTSTEVLREFMSGTCYRASLLLETAKVYGWSPSLSMERVQEEFERSIGYIAMIAHESGLNHATWIDDSGTSQTGKVVGIGGNVDLEEGEFSLRLAIIDPALTKPGQAMLVDYQRVVDFRHQS
ncbi:MAG TPA: hypothetical protein VG992_01625 [Candidatus Saccharimonadales bacterium]|nr:hypothetical protein [Candidatus Saccharimonadales bacterium]